MNLKQLSYQYGRLKNSVPHVIYPTYTAICLAYLKDWGPNFIRSHSMEDFVPAAVLTFFGILYGGVSVSSIVAKRRLSKFKKNENLYPESEKSIILDDKQGLEMLLEKTAKSKRREWATVLNVHEDKSRSVIYEIIDPESAKDMKLVGSVLKKILWMNSKLIKEKGYGGTHHYHPNKIIKSRGAEHFAINLNDRGINIGLTNLLTFNLPEGPEIIGYDALNTYIPSDKSKQELVRATPKQIMEYLS